MTTRRGGRPSPVPHHDHVRVIWEFTHAYGTLGALTRFEAGLRRITAGNGHQEKFHATITHAFAFLVGERIVEQGPLSWDEFERTNTDLFEWPNRVMQQMYPGDSLTRAIARRTFVMPFGRCISNETAQQTTKERTSTTT